jgi:hypothetical protein
VEAKVISPDTGTFIASLRALGDLIESSADPGEEATQLSDEVIDALERVEIFKLIAPRAVGGMEAHPLQVIDALRTLSYFDGSTGWYCQAAVTGPAVAGAFLGDRAVDEIFFSGAVCNNGFTQWQQGPALLSGHAGRECSCDDRGAVVHHCGPLSRGN